ncbi:MAG: ATP-binding protein [Luteolibacter sp.]
MDIETSSAIKFFFPNPSLVQVLFEALANALDAGATEVTIRIEIDAYTASETLRFTITDNGGGFDDASFDRFCRLLKPRDADHKGLGRLVYLNYFDRVEVDSTWGDQRRTFLFSEHFKGESQTSTLPAAEPQLTILRFTQFNGRRLKSYDDIKPGTLKDRIIEQFLPTLVERRRCEEPFLIRLELETEETRDDKDFFTTDETITPADLPDLKQVHITDPTLDAFEGIEMLYQVRSGMGPRRILTAASIDGRTIPINLIQPSSIPADHSVLCLFFSKLFNGTADTARQRLVLPDSISEPELRRVLQRELGKVLIEEIAQIGERNEATKEQFEDKFPHLLGFFEETTVGLIDKDEALDIAQRRFFKTQKEVLQAETLDEETYEKSLELSSRSLTEYILYRDLIIRRMKEMTAANTEAEIHNLIAPRYEQFHEDEFINDIYRNNAWLLDDKFMSFRTILSEARMDSVIEAITLEDAPLKDDGRPDITMIFSADPAKIEAVDVVVVELKRITDKEKDNQFVINQLLARARKLAAHCPNVQRIWYYAVIHINAEMEETLLQQKFVPMFSKGRVFYNEYLTRRPDGSTVPTPTYVISFDAIIGDAECRNHTFLEILKSGMRSLNKVEDSAAATVPTTPPATV